MSKPKKPPEEKCPHCGCPELRTYARQRSAGFVVITSCPACGKVVPPAMAEPPPLAPPEPHAVTSEAERKVLDAMWAIPDGTLAFALRGLSADNWVSLPDSIRNALLAEKLRRTP